MEKVMSLDDKLKRARIEKNDLAKALYQTLKGEYETAIKKAGIEPGDATFEKIVRSMIKNNEMIGSDDAKKENALLMEFLPAQLSEDEVRTSIQSLLAHSVDKVEAYKSGNKSTIGFFMGAMKTSGIAADPKVLARILNEELANA